MNKDTSFSSSRLLNLCRKDMVENWKTNILRIVMLYGIMSVSLVSNGYNKYQNGNFDVDPMMEYSLIAFLVFGWIFGCLFTSVSFDKLKTKTSRISVLMNPATPFEKYFSKWFMSTIVYILIFVIAFLLADYTRVLICRLIFPGMEITATNLMHLFKVQPEPQGLFVNKYAAIYTLLGYFFTQSFFFLGSAVWPKNSFVKTFAAGLGIVISYTLFTVGMARLLIDRNVYIPKPSFEPSIETVNMVGMSVVIFFTLFNWVMAYYRFKETEIINRM